MKRAYFKKELTMIVETVLDGLDETGQKHYKPISS
jgi:hypothetical protein